MARCARGGLALAAVMAAAVAQAQPASPTTPAPPSAPHGLAGTWRGTLALGHTALSQGVLDGRTRWLRVPSWSLNVDRWITDRLAVALQTDVVIESYRIEHGGSELLERAYPVSIVPAAIFKPWAQVALVGGIGVEYASGHALTLTRLGVEYGVHVGARHEVGVALVWDNKWNYYNSIGLAFTTTRLWPRGH